MTEDQIKHLVNRFLSWKLPANFRPDAGISYVPPSHADKLPPSGTNLFDAMQADAMVRYMLDGMPPVIPAQQQPDDKLARIAKAIRSKVDRAKEELGESSYLGWIYRELADLDEFVRRPPAVPPQDAPAQSTPGAMWREEGLPDPHGARYYHSERAKLIGGDLSDDQVANAVFLDPSIGNLTIAKDRIRWLSRQLEMLAAVPPQESKLRLFLAILSKAGGETSGSDSKWNWVNYFCDDEPLDTFNQASKRKLTRVTHDSDTDESMVYLTDAGRAFLAADHSQEASGT